MRSPIAVRSVLFWGRRYLMEVVMTDDVGPQGDRRARVIAALLTSIALGVNRGVVGSSVVNWCTPVALGNAN